MLRPVILLKKPFLEREDMSSPVEDTMRFQLPLPTAGYWMLPGHCKNSDGKWVGTSYGVPKRPNRVHRFLMQVLLGMRWIEIE